MAENKPENGQSTEPEIHYHHGHRRHDGASGVFVGLILILLGVLFFLDNQGVVPSGRWWQFFLTGLGGIFLIEALVRWLQKDPAEAIKGRVIAGVVLAGIGVAFIIGASNWWPLILIVVGVVVILGGLWRRD